MKVGKFEADFSNELVDDKWMFPKTVGFPPEIIQFNRVFHYFHHPFWGKHPYFWFNTQMMISAPVKGCFEAPKELMAVKPNGFGVFV